MEPELVELEVDKLLLDPDNPRFFHLTLKGKGAISEEELQSEIEGDESFPTLVKAIRADGVKDPIWVRESNGKYIVIEGNRRTVILRNLIKEGARPPKDGISYKKVRAHIMPKETSETETLLQKARLQTGKKEWGKFNVSAVVYRLRHDYFLEFDDIATEMQTSIREVKLELSNYETFLKYVKETGDANPRRYSYITDRPTKVIEWMEQSDANTKQYFEWINPNGNNNKLRSVATRGGLRDFAKIVDDQEALKQFIEDPNVTVEDALAIVKENDIMKGMPFVKKLAPLAQSLFSLDDTQIEKIKQEPTIIADLKKLQRACKNLIEKLEPD